MRHKSTDGGTLTKTGTTGTAIIGKALFGKAIVTATGVLLASCALFAFFTATALAEAPKLIPEGSFSSATTSPVGVAVDQSSGDVYIAGFSNPSQPPIDKFDASDKLLSPPSPFGEEGLHAGIAVDPVNGDVYVLSVFGTIETYDPSNGKLLSSFPVQESGNLFGLTFVQIATDSAGDVYVPVVSENEVLEYSSTGTLLNTFTGSGAGALKEPVGVAVDSSGNLWVADAGNNRVEEINSANLPLGEIKSEGVQSVALDAHGDVFAGVENSADLCGSRKPPCHHLMEYSSDGRELADVGAGTFGAGTGLQFSIANMVAVDEANGRVYIPDMSSELVWVFGPPSGPAVDREFTAEVGTSEAKLGALVKAGGIETSYRFEYGPTAAYGQTTPFPEGSVGEGIGSRTVWAAASGLAAGTTYHYRVIATNELGTSVGPDQTFTTETAAQAACPNEQLRSGFSGRLPDCRAYELVTAPTKTSVQVSTSEVAAADGNAVAFTTFEPLPGAPTGGRYYVATRGAGGWNSEDMIPLESYTGALCSVYSSEVSAYSDELSKALVSDGRDGRASEPGGSNLEKQECNAEGLQVVGGEPVGYQNLLLRDNGTGAYQLVNALEPGFTSVPADAHFQGASSDLSHVVFSEKAPLTSDAPAGVEDLYEWDEGTVRLLTVLPDGAPVTGSLAQALFGADVVSSDGSHVLFTSGGDLYVRIDGERTVQVDESQGPGASGGSSFQAATADGSRVFFTDESRLTADSTAAAGAPDLYECALPAGASKCELSDLTVAAAGEHADVLRVSVLGAKDSSHVYFLAKGVLASNTREYTDSQGDQILEKAVNGQHNLYVWDGATITFVASLGEGDLGAGQASPDGAWFAFNSTKRLTGYDNTNSSGSLSEEIFLYDANSKRLVCASCNPSGEAPASSPGGARIEVETGHGVKRYLSDGGRLIFDTEEALVPSDTDGGRDVYEYENGGLYSISSGTSTGGSFIGASESGDDVFFLSRQQLVPQDTEEEAQLIYDARVEGGLPALSSPPPCTNADSCRAPVSPQPSIYGAPSSQTFSGAGNFAAPSASKPAVKPKSKPAKCKRGFVKKKGRCVKKSNRKSKQKVNKARHTNRKGK